MANSVKAKPSQPAKLHREWKRAAKRESSTHISISDEICDWHIRSGREKWAVFMCVARFCCGHGNDSISLIYTSDIFVRMCLNSTAFYSGYCKSINGHMASHKMCATLDYLQCAAVLRLCHFCRHHCRCWLFVAIQFSNRSVYLCMLPFLFLFLIPINHFESLICAWDLANDFQFVCPIELSKRNGLNSQCTQTVTQNVHVRESWTSLWNGEGKIWK